MEFAEIESNMHNENGEQISPALLSLCMNPENTSNSIDGVLFIACEEEGEKTDPEKINEWFGEDFIKMHKVFAIKEEEAFLLKIYTRNREIANKLIRKKGGRKPMLMGHEVHGEIVFACGRCGYRSSEGSNVRRHLRRSVCARDRGYSKKQLDGLDRVERQKFIRRIASAKFRAKKKLEIDETFENGSVISDVGLQETECLPPSNLGNDNTECGTLAPQSRLRLKRKVRRRKSPAALTLGPLEERDAVSRVSFDVFTLTSGNVRVAWKPSACHKACGDDCQIVFKGARMKRRCLHLPLPIVLTYRKLDCRTHHCNFTLFHPHARRAIKTDPDAKTSLSVRTYGDTVMTQDFYHHFVSLSSVMKMKASQCARHLTSVWETILCERLKTNAVPEGFRKIITLSKQTVKSIWSNIDDETARKDPLNISKPKRRKRRTYPAPSNSLLQQILPSDQQRPTTDTTFVATSQPPHHTPVQEEPTHQTSTTHQMHPHIHQQHEFQPCMKRFTPVTPVMPKPIGGAPHPIPLTHTHSAMQGPHHHPHWGAVVHQSPAPSQYPHSVPYVASVPVHNDDYYSVQASFVTQYTPSLGAPP